MRHQFLAILIQLIGLVAGVAGANAHEIRPAVVTADIATPGKYTISITVNLEALLAGIGSEHKDTNEAPGAAQYNQLRALSPEQLRARFEAFSATWLQDIIVSFGGSRATSTIDEITIPVGVDPALARISTIKLSGVIPTAASNFQWAYPKQFGTSVLRVKRQGSSELETDWLRQGASSVEMPLVAGPAKAKLRVLLDYISLGFTHILPLGIDHILFVLGLFLLSTQMRPLLIQVTAFTIAHSITLALGLYGIVEVSPKIVEPMIALSIVFVAVENLLITKLSVWRPFIVFGFGLLHGLGFAGVLQELGLPREQYVVGLTGFNIGVELGQLAVITLAWIGTAYWFRHRTWYRRRIVWPASLAIALIGAFWTIERIWFA